MQLKSFLFLLLLVSGLHSQKISLVKTIHYKQQFPEIKSPVALNIHFLGNILIGDDFANQLFAVNPHEMTLSRASNISTFSPLSNPVAVASGPLNIFVLDYDNQKILRYDVNLRLMTELKLEDIYDFPPTANIIYMAIDFKKEIYLLDESDYKIIKINDQNEIIQTYGGVQSSVLEFRQIEKIQSCGKTSFITVDYLKKQLIKFGLAGNLQQEIPVEEEVVDFCGNLEGWFVLLLTEHKVIYGKNNRLLDSCVLPDVKISGEAVLAMDPKDNSFWLIDDEHLFLFAIDNRELH